MTIQDHDIPEAGEYFGHQGFGRWLDEDWGTAWSDWSLEPEEFIDAGNTVVVIAHLTATGRGSGLEVKRQDGLVYELRDGKITRLDYYNSKEQALEAAGLKE